MTKEELAAQLDGTYYEQKITPAQHLAAKKAGLVVVYAGGLDEMVFRGAINGSAYTEPDYTTSVFILNGEVIPEDKCPDGCKWFRAAIAGADKIRAVYDPLDQEYSWTYETDIPHATFDIFEAADDNRKWCRGIVFKRRK